MDLSGFFSDLTGSGESQGFSLSDSTSGDNISSFGGTDKGGVGDTLDSIGQNLPFGEMIGGFLEKFQVQRNLNLIGEFGLNSWGASTSPEETKANFAKTVYPYIEGRLQEITDSAGKNLATVLNEIEDNLLANKYYRQALEQFHSKADSTKAANAWAKQEFETIRLDFVQGIKDQFSKYGVKINRVPSNETARQLASDGHIFEMESGKPFQTDRDLDQYLAKQYYNWTVDFSSVKVSETGEIQTSNGGMGLGMVAVLGGIAWKMFKK